jgi:hypothetical protein
MTRLTQSIGTCLAVIAALTSPGCGGSSGSVTPDAPNADSTSAVVGSAGGVVVVPTGAAGVKIPAGVLPQATTVTVERLPTSTVPGTGPLPTSLKQYPPYYEFSTSPAIANFGDSVRVGVCQVTDPSSPFYPPEPTHPRLRLAHRVGSTVELLERVDVSDFLNCTGVTASLPTGSERFAFAARAMSRARNLFALFSPAPAYAAHGGLGGKVKSFSPFAGVDEGPKNAATVFPVNPRAAFLTVAAQDVNATPAVIIDLATLGFVQGDLVRLQRLGDFSFQLTGPENGTSMIAVFSSSNVLLGPTVARRVPGAIATGLPPFVSQPTSQGQIPTDIPEDFFVVNPTVQIPAGARFLFVGTPDIFNGDNQDFDGDYAISVSPASLVASVSVSKMQGGFLSQKVVNPLANVYTSRLH